MPSASSGHTVVYHMMSYARECEYICLALFIKYVIKSSKSLTMSTLFFQNSKYKLYICSQTPTPSNDLNTY